MITEKFLKVLLAAIHEEWSDIITYAQKHNVFPLVFEVASASVNFVDLPTYPMYTANAMAIIAGQVKRTSAFLNLYREFVEADLFPLVMKGVICRQLYGDYSDHRVSGDEDILIRIEDFEKIKQIMLGEGYIPEKENISEAELKTLQELSFHNPNTGLSVDVHINSMGFENDLRCQMNKYFKDAFDNRIQMEVDSQVIYTMSHTDHFLFLLLHTFKHFTGGGFGIREVIDILLFEEKYIEALVKEKSVSTWKFIKGSRWTAITAICSL